MIDFGLSKRFKCPKTGNHIQEKKCISCVGTPRYQSLAAFNKREQSRKHDLESIGYLLIYFGMKGNLPWMEVENEDRKK